MTCLSCGEIARDDLCRVCRDSVRPAPDRRVAGVLTRSAFVHEGAARTLVHRLKYSALAAAAEPLARAMVSLLPTTARSLVPVPRVVLRRWRYGVCPATELARALERMTGLRIVACLRPAMWVPRRAGPAGIRRGSPRFAIARLPEPGAVLVDDVVTTGTTLREAGRVTGVCHALTATAADRPVMSSGL